MKTIKKRDGTYEYNCKSWELFVLSVLCLILGIIIGIVNAIVN